MVSHKASLAARRGTLAAPMSFQIHSGHIMQLLFCTMLLNTAFFVYMLSNPRNLSSANDSQSCSESSVVSNHSSILIQRPCQPITVAYAISVIKCSDIESLSTRGMLDGALVLRHSIHQTSKHSLYDHKIYALVHENAWTCSSILKSAGFDEVRKVSRPVEKDEISGEYLRNKIESEWCCGHDEFIKLYAYNLPEPIVVHIDIDFVFSKPLDDLFDALLYHKDSEIGRAAREQIPRQNPEAKWPENPQAMMTLDWGQVQPGEHAGYQAGFLVARTNPGVMEEMIQVVQKGDFDKDTGWGKKGYRGFVGAMAMQGLVAYYYNEIAPDTSVELNQCRFNHMGREVQCRSGQSNCEACFQTPFGEIYNIHYNTCGKPWNCRVEVGHGRLYHCQVLHRFWHLVRLKLETDLSAISPKEEKAKVNLGSSGSHSKNIFFGHCAADKIYIPLAEGHNESIVRVSQLYKPSSGL